MVAKHTSRVTAAERRDTLPMNPVPYNPGGGQDAGDGEDKHQTDAQLFIAGITEGEFDGDERAAFTSVNHADLTSISPKIGQSGHIPNSWILLDSNQSTVDIFYNGDILKNVRRGSGYMDVHCNAGITSTNLVGDLPDYGMVWYHPNGIANILSLARVKQRYRVTYDSSKGNEFIVHKSDGGIRVFVESERGLYFMDTAATGTLLVNTVDDNKSRYTNRDYSRALLARKIQKTIGRPSIRSFIEIVDNILLPNCPITRRDIMAAEDIFGPAIGSLKGKTVQRAGERIETTHFSIPAPIMSQYR